MTKRLLIFIIILILVLIFRLFLFYSQKTQYLDGQSVSFETTLLSDPKFSGNYQNLSVNLPTGELVFVQTAAYPEYRYGEKISLIGKLKVRLLNGKSTILSLSFPKIKIVKNSENYLLAIVNSIRQKIINQFQTVLPKDSSALLLGIVFGIKEDFSTNFLQSLKTVGVMHVIAASGMNVTMISGFFFYIFSLIVKRQKAIFLSIAAMIFYDFLAGFQASIIRASIMAGLAFSSQILGRQRDGIYILFLTAFIMLFLWPQFLTDIGFQLSFASTLGIMIIPNLFKRWENALSGDLLTTVSAQAATLPILLGSFGTYSLWSVVVNALVLWTVPILMILGGFAAIIAFVFAPLTKLLLYLCLPFLIYFQSIANFFAGLKGTLTVQNLPWQLTAAYYLLLISALIFGFKKTHD
jgi:competence protein ComEC